MLPTLSELLGDALIEVPVEVEVPRQRRWWEKLMLVFSPIGVCYALADIVGWL